MASVAAPVYFIHDNEAWLEPFTTALDKIGIPHVEWDISEGSVDSIDFSQEPPRGIFYNRVSPSSHYRNKRYAMELTSGILTWLQSYDRIVINDTRTLELELSKMNQIAVMRRYGIAAPRTVAVMGKTRLAEKAKEFNEFPFLLKHNRSGSGRGVRDFYSVWELEQFLKKEADQEWPVDNIHLIQSFISNSFFYRLEFCDGELVYAIRVRTGEFANCPNDLCQLDTTPKVGEPKFTIIRPEEFTHELIPRLQAMFKDYGYVSASVELIVDPESGQSYVFDVNANTNFNRGAEEAAGLSFEETGVGAFAQLIERYEEKYFEYTPRDVVVECTTQLAPMVIGELSPSLTPSCSHSSEGVIVTPHSHVALCACG